MVQELYILQRLTVLIFNKCIYLNYNLQNSYVIKECWTITTRQIGFMYRKYVGVHKSVSYLKFQMFYKINIYQNFTIFTRFFGSFPSHPKKLLGVEKNEPSKYQQGKMFNVYIQTI